jgi:ribosomal protein S27AE
MATEIQHHNCPNCGPSPFNVPAVNHVLHLLITLFSCGGWALVWFFLCNTRGYARCGSCGMTMKQAYRQAKSDWKKGVAEDRRLEVLRLNESGPAVGDRVKVTHGQHKGKFGTVTANDGQSATISDRKGRTLTLPISDFRVS